MAYVRKGWEAGAPADEFIWFCQTCMGSEFDEASAEADDPMLCCECGEPHQKKKYFFIYHERSHKYDPDKEYCKQCFVELADMKVNPIGHPIPLEDFSFILLGLVPMDMRESFVCKYQAELIAFLEAELQPAFEAFKLSEAWQGFIPAAAGQSTQDEDLVQVLSKEADSAKDASLPNQAAGETAELQASDSFADYEPAKLDYGPPHVEHVVESASLACVAPVDITWKLSLPADLLASGALSRVQLEAVVYAVQQHEKILPTGARAGFFIGDGTGVGKGREGAAIILENFIRGRTRAVWFTCNTDLAVDAMRDLRDIGAGEIPLLSLSSAGYGKIEDLFDEGVLLVTYSCLVASSAGKGTRYEQLVEWLGERFDGVFLFDEAHKAKGAAMDQPVGRAVVGLQQAFLRARVVYLSATGATQVSDMSYMTRLGLWGAGTHFTNFKEFAAVLSSSSANGGMEMLAVQLKSSGAYLARSLGLRGVDFHLEVATLSDAQRRVYDQTASLWLYIHEEVALLHSRGLFRSVGGVLASAQTKCFQQVLLSFKVDEIQRQVRRALRAGKCAVIGLQSTGETAVKRAMGSGTDATLERLVSPAAEAIEIMIDTIERACDRSTSVWSSSSVSTFRQGVLSRLANIDLPPSAIDALIDYFGANVAEMTGRAKRLLRKADGSGYRLVTRSERGVPVSGINLLERQRFQSGEKLIAILSDAGATGVSLHADTNEGSQRRRVHIVPEIGFCASKIVQQFGRTHRTNQLMPPEYVLLMCESAGEALTGSAVARKLEGLGALTKGDKMAGQGETGGLGVNLETRSGQRALTDFMLMLNAGAQQDLSDKVRLHVAGAVDVKHLLTRLQLVPFKAQLQLLRAFTRKIKSNESATASQLAATSVVVTKESVIFKSRRNASETVTLKEIEVAGGLPVHATFAHRPCPRRFLCRTLN